MHTSIKVLLIEDNVLDAELLIETLKANDDQPVEIDRVATLKAAFERLTIDKYDAVLLDLSLPDSSGMEALSKVRKFSTEIPIVVMTGLDDKEIALACVKNGAQDYLVKGRPSRESVYRSIRYAVERGRAEGATKQLKLLEQREQFIAMLAHDLRSPINGSDRIISMMLDGFAGSLSEKQNQLLSMVSGTNKTLLLMINNVLDAYSLEAGGETFNITKIDLAPLITECLQDMEPIAQGKNIRLRHHNICQNAVQADAIAMRRVINNLVSNAIKFTPAGGCIEVTLEEQTNFAVLKVKDNGCGISAEQLPHLFERFYQTDIKNRSTGLGLGLHLCKHLLEAQNGSISCVSETKVGTTFEVTLPLAFKESARALIIDDNATNRLTLQRILEFLAIDSISVSSGKDALLVASKHSFQAVFMDLQMPGIDGFTTTRALRDSGFDLPIVAYTGNVTTDKQKFDEAGISDILQKPIDIAAVKKIVDQWMTV